MRTESRSEPFDSLRAMESFFAEASSIRSTEKTYHALFCHHLACAGVPVQSIAREARFDGAPVDVLVYTLSAEGCFEANPSALLAAFEFKGGAYGFRNALQETIQPDGFCSDMKKLQLLQARGVSAWFVCIDQAHLGIALNETLRLKVAAQCSARSLGFAYFCQGQSTFLFARPGKNLVTYPVREIVPVATEARPSWFKSKGVVIQHAGAFAAEVEGSEDDYVFRIYHALRLAGFSAQRLSLETYFSFARTGKTRMRLRPDLCVFESSVGGNFNLYRGGSRESSNDALKLHALTALIEVKGSLGTSRKSNLDFAILLEDDLDKLAHWKAVIQEATKAHGICRSTEPEYLLLVFDPRPSELSKAQLADLEARAARHGVEFSYRHLPRSQRDKSHTVKREQRSQSGGIERAPSQRAHEAPGETRFYKMAKVPEGRRELFTYFAAILAVTGMDQGKTFPLTRFLKNVSGHVNAGRIEKAEGGLRLTKTGIAYFEDRYRRGPGGPLDLGEVAEISKQIRTGEAPGWIPI